MISSDFETLQRLIQIGISLSSERDFNRLMERILIEAKELCNADGGTLYLCKDSDSLHFEIMRNDSLGIALGGTTGAPVEHAPLKLYDPESGAENQTNVATWAALTGTSVNIPDAYEAERFDFSGTKRFDAGNGYRSRSFLTVPLKSSEGEVIGVLQLINAQPRGGGAVIPFEPTLQPLIEALASQAAVALENRHLLDAQQSFLDAFIELIASAIDEKSPYTGGHCQRVPELTKMLARAACAEEEGVFADFKLSDDEMYELHVGAWLHDCGKITTPEYVVDKATKLETIYNRIHELRARFEILKRDATIEALQARLAGEDPEEAARREAARHAELDAEFAFVAECNVGGEWMDPARVDRLKEIGARRWQRTISDRLGLSHEELKRKERTPEPALPADETLLGDRAEHIIERHPNALEGYERRREHGFTLTPPEHEYNLGELYNLSVSRGTLTAEERFKINDHIIQTIMMLKQLPFPKQLARVPEYAGNHHERMDGKGYPRGLKRDEMSLPARMMAIADIFEALTAGDRPYKRAKPLSVCIDIMAKMTKGQHIDPELFQLFLRSGVYREYAERFLAPEQIDEVDISAYADIS